MTIFSFVSDTMTTIFEAITILRQVFDKYAGKEGDPKTLTKKEVLELLKEQLGEAPSSKAELDDFFNMLDDDGDGVVDFNEYVVLCASLALMLAP
uniref:EF-hand domain-containing protein n=2 Tax=Oryzias latipes TaxID=8090 RepID=A0A3B3IPP5_ORYLA